MIRRFVGLWLSLTASLLACAQGGGGDAISSLPDTDPARAPARVVLISVAGLQPAHYGVQEGVQEDVRRGTHGRPDVPMPRLARLAQEGAYAEAVEVAALNHRLKQKGVFPAKELNDKLIRKMAKKKKKNSKA